MLIHVYTMLIHADTRAFVYTFACVHMLRSETMRIFWKLWCMNPTFMWTVIDLEVGVRGRGSEVG